MKYKILLAGKNRSTIDDFFYVMNDEFECMTTSNRGGDVINHIAYFQPDIFVYCFAAEPKDEVMKLLTALEAVDRKHQKLILIGEPELCDEYSRLRPELVKMVLYRPISAANIKDRILKYFEQCEQEAAERAKMAEQALQATADEQKQILVIDDDPMMLRLIKTELKDHYNVATAVNGKIGLKFLERKTTDLILLDYEMPEEDGTVILEKLRANPKTQDIPVVFLTGINDTEKIRKVLSMKPQGYLLKPIECKQLVDTIHQIIG